MPAPALIVPKTGVTFAGKPFPAFILAAGDDAVRRFVEFFTARLPNPNTRAAYAHAVGEFCRWADDRRLTLKQLNPVQIAGYVEDLGTRASVAKVKQHLSALRMLCDWLVLGQVLPMNPAASVRGPKRIMVEGRTPVLSADEARLLLGGIDVATEVGLRDRALIAVMAYALARVSAAVAMTRADYRVRGKRGWIRLREKGGKLREIPAHHNLIAYLDAYLEAAELDEAADLPLFRSTRGRSGKLTARAMTRRDALRMIKRRAKAVGLPADICCHTFRGTGITTYLANGGGIEKAQRFAGHASPTTTKLYDRTKDELSLDEIERIVI